MMQHGKCAAVSLVAMILRLRSSMMNLGQFIINYKSRVREFCSMRKTLRIGVQINLKRPETREKEIHILN